MTPYLLATLAALYGAPTAARCADLYPAAEVAADLAGLPPAVVVGLLATETRCRPLEGTLEPVLGVGQVSWSVWGPLLAGHGIGEADLMDTDLGTFAAGYVLAALRARHKPRTTDLLLCLYSDGWQARRYRTDCTYSRAVLGMGAAMGGGR